MIAGIIIGIIVACFALLGISICIAAGRKTPEEQYNEDEEQARYIREYVRKSQHLDIN